MASKTKTTEEPADDGFTAKLMRGETYTYKGMKFVRGEARPVSREFALALDKEVTTSVVDGERFERKRFKVTGLEEEETEADEDDDDVEDSAVRRRVTKKPSRRNLRSR